MSRLIIIVLLWWGSLGRHWVTRQSTPIKRACTNNLGLSRPQSLHTLLHHLQFSPWGNLSSCQCRLKSPINTNELATIEFSHYCCILVAQVWTWFSDYSTGGMFDISMKRGSMLTLNNAGTDILANSSACLLDGIEDGFIVKSWLI